MKLKNKVLMGVTLAVSLIGLSLGQSMMNTTDATAQSAKAPSFEVDPFWPQPLPNGWILGNVIGVAVDTRDHVYIVHRAWGDGIFKPFDECIIPHPVRNIVIQPALTQDAVVVSHRVANAFGPL